MVSYSFYEADNRVRRYAEALVKAGCSVDALSLRRDATQPDREIIDGVAVHRLQGRRKDEKTPLHHLLRLCRFWLAAARFLFRMHPEESYDLVHVHNPPDFMVFAACFSKWEGAKIILDIHDIVPELYENKFPSTFASWISQRAEVGGETVDAILRSRDCVQSSLAPENNGTVGGSGKDLRVY